MEMFCACAPSTTAKLAARPRRTVLRNFMLVSVVVGTRRPAGRRARLILPAGPRGVSADFPAVHEQPGRVGVLTCRTMFNPSQEDVRRFFCSVHAKARAGQVLDALE